MTVTCVKCRQIFHPIESTSVVGSICPSCLDPRFWRVKIWWRDNRGPFGDSLMETGGHVPFHAAGNAVGAVMRLAEWRGHESDINKWTSIEAELVDPRIH